MLKTLLTTSLLFLTFASFSQSLTLQQKLQSNLDLQGQFQALLMQSKGIDADFKAIRKSNVEIIQKNVADSISKYTKEIATLKSNTSSSTTTLASLRDSLQTAQSELTIETAKKDSISFIGIDFSKSSYHTMVWTIISVLATALFIILISFRKAKVDAVEHQSTAEELQNDFQAFKKKALETEQKLKRQLLDEQLKSSN